MDREEGTGAFRLDEPKHELMEEPQRESIPIDGIIFDHSQIAALTAALENINIKLDIDQGEDHGNFQSGSGISVKSVDNDTNHELKIEFSSETIMDAGQAGSSAAGAAASGSVFPGLKTEFSSEIIMDAGQTGSSAAASGSVFHGLKTEFSREAIMDAGQIESSATASGSVNNAQGLSLYYCNKCNKLNGKVRYRCMVCNDFNLCPSCNKTEEHPHDMLGIRSRLASDTTESLIISRETNLKFLVHARQCKDTNCKLPYCPKMKSFLNHHNNCKRRSNGGCLICKQLAALTFGHVLHCQEVNCYIPCCPMIKRKLKHQKAQQRLQHTQLLRERMGILGAPKFRQPGEKQLTTTISKIREETERIRQKMSSQLDVIGRSADQVDQLSVGITMLQQLKQVLQNPNRNEQLKQILQIILKSHPSLMDVIKKQCYAFAQQQGAQNDGNAEPLSNQQEQKEEAEDMDSQG